MHTEATSNLGGTWTQLSLGAYFAQLKHARDPGSTASELLGQGSSGLLREAVPHIRRCKTQEDQILWGFLPTGPN